MSVDRTIYLMIITSCFYFSNHYSIDSMSPVSLHGLQFQVGDNGLAFTPLVIPNPHLDLLTVHHCLTYAAGDEDQRGQEGDHQQ